MSTSSSPMPPFPPSAEAPRSAVGPSSGEAGAGAAQRRRGLMAAVFALAAAFTALPLLIAPVPPFGPFATELSRVALAGSAAGSEVQRLLEPELTGSALVTRLWGGLAVAFGPLGAGKALVLVLIALLPLAAWRWLAVTGRPRWFALAAFPLVYGAETMGGSLAVAFAAPFAALTLAEVVACHLSPDRWRAALPFALAALTAALSASLAAAAALGALVLAAALPASRRDLVRLAPAVLGPLLAAAVAIAPSGDPDAPGPELSGAPLDAFTRLGAATVEQWSALFDDWAFLGLVGVFVVGLLWRTAEGRLVLGRSPRALEWTSGAIGLAIVAASLGRWPEAHTAVAAGLGPLAVVLGLAWLDLPPGRAGRAAVVLGLVALPAGFSVGVGRAVAAFEAEELPPSLITLIAGVPDGARLAVLDETGRSEVVRAAPRDYVHSLHLALNAGVPSGAPDAGDDDGVRASAGAAIPEVGGPPHRFMGSEAACWYGYLLLGTREAPTWGHLAPRLTYLGHAASWSLWRLEHARMPHCRVPIPWLDPSPPTSGEPVAEAAEPPAPQARPPRRALPSRLGLRIGHARGRDLHDRYAPADE